MFSPKRGGQPWCRVGAMYRRLLLLSGLLLRSVSLGDSTHPSDHYPLSPFSDSSHRFSSDPPPSSLNGTLPTPSSVTPPWHGRSLSSDSSDFNRDYFTQMNAMNHRPSSSSSSLYSEESQLKPSISAPAGNEVRSTHANGENVYYFSPSSYGQAGAIGKAPQSSHQQPQQQQQPSSASRGVSNSSSSSSGGYTYWPSSPSRDKHLNGEKNPAIDPTASKVWSIPHNGNSKPSPADSSTARRDAPPSSYSTELNKLLMQRYYNRDINAMSAVLGKYPPEAGNSHLEHRTNKEVVPITVHDPSPAVDEEDEEAADEEETVVDEKSIESGAHQETPPPHYGRPVSSVKYSSLPVATYQGRSGETLVRVRTRPAYTTGLSRSIPIRYQTAHSHQMPHYYIPHGESSSHHHLMGGDKGSGWLGSGLAAGILIGAIPFGIMMATVMPSLLTTALPIVNTATVAGKRRKRSAGGDMKSLLLDQSLETLSFLLNKGLNTFLAKLKEPLPAPAPPSPQRTTSKNDGAYEYASMGSSPDEMFKTMARYALAAVDEPKCIKEMVCTLVAGGKASKTTPIQKTLYMLAKWIPKDIERTLGLNGLFTAIRSNACLATYQCPITVLDGFRKRSFQAPPQPPPATFGGVPFRRARQMA